MQAHSHLLASLRPADPGAPPTVAHGGPFPVRVHFGRNALSCAFVHVEACEDGSWTTHIATRSPELLIAYASEGEVFSYNSDQGCGEGTVLQIEAAFRNHPLATVLPEPWLRSLVAGVAGAATLGLALWVSGEPFALGWAALLVPGFFSIWVLHGIVLGAGSARAASKAHMLLMVAFTYLWTIGATMAGAMLFFMVALVVDPPH